LNAFTLEAAKEAHRAHLAWRLKMEREDFKALASYVETPEERAVWFHQACRIHWGALARWLFRKGLEANRPALGGFRPLISASYLGDVEVVQSMLASGANPRVSDIEGRLSLVEASGQGHLRVMELLLDRGCVLDQADATQTNPLVAAAGEGRLEAVRWLLKRGASLQTAGSQALSRAIARGRVEIVNELLVRGIQVADEDLHLAVLGGSQSVLEMIVQANPGACKRNREALYEAVSSGNIGMVRLLIGKGADPSALVIEQGNQSALDLARKMSREDLVDLLKLAPAARP